MGSNPVRGKPLFPRARNFTLIAQYWLVPGPDLRLTNSFLHNQTKINSVQTNYNDFFT